MQLVVVKAKGNNKNLEGHSTLPWSKQSKFFMELFWGKIIKIIKRNKHQTKQII
jgi:hypothetical protein